MTDKLQKFIQLRNSPEVTLLREIESVLSRVVKVEEKIDTISNGNITVKLKIT